MRRLILTLAGVVAVVSVSAIFVSGASGALPCRTIYCQNTIGTNLNVSCRPKNSSFTLNPITVTSGNQIRRITITLRSRLQTIKVVNLPKKVYVKVLRGVVVSTAGLASGVHTITIVVQPRKGRSFSKTLHFAVCTPPKPRTTG
ncbi:MAG: hypothetical protein ACR2JH_04400 [Solirubrobacteraceae bacterium]